MAIIQKSMSNRGRSKSPSGTNLRSSSALQDDFTNKEMKWSITTHDPLQRMGEDHTWDNEASEEEHISDDDDGEKFQYDGTGNILPNYAYHDDKMAEVATILENLNLNDSQTIKRLEELTATERALANARNIGTSVDSDVVTRLAEDKHALTGNEALDLRALDQDAEARRHKLETYQAYRRKIIDQENGNLPNGGVRRVRDDALPGDEFMVPYTSAVEDRMDLEFALQLNETIKEGPVDSSMAQSRVMQTITRGNFFQLVDPQARPKMFLLCMDFSPESIFALEWALGTVLVDGAVLFIVCVIEDTDTNHQLKGSTAEAAREKTRMEMLSRARKQVLTLLKLTKLQIHIVVEIVHHPIPRHLILEVIDNLQPTLVVVGSKGLSAIKGVLLGSLSNYLVTKLTVPVMVVREKLKKINRFKSGLLVFANNIKPLTLSEARVD